MHFCSPVLYGDRFFVYLLISQRRWEEIAEDYLMESLSRQVSWIVLDLPPVETLESPRGPEDQECIAALFPEKKAVSPRASRYHPELAVLETDEVCPYRLAVTFEVCHFCLYSSLLVVTYLSTVQATKLSAQILMFQVSLRQLSD